MKFSSSLECRSQIPLDAKPPLQMQLLAPLLDIPKKKIKKIQLDISPCQTKPALSLMQIDSLPQMSCVYTMTITQPSQDTDSQALISGLLNTCLTHLRTIILPSASSIS